VDLSNPNHKGNVAEAAIALHAAKLGIEVLRPQFEHCRYDLAFDLGDRIVRIQCKWVARYGDVIPVRAYSARYRSDGTQVRHRYSPADVDAVAAYCEELDVTYLVPIEVIGARHQIQLRLTPARNGQVAAINWASTYELTGAVAQLEVAPPWHGGGRGFESHQLHLSQPSVVPTIGVNELRCRLGLYMERAAAGQSFEITRRGRPYVRLSPAVSPEPVDPGDLAG
jgi:prevent-host-death family protein